MSGIWTRKHLPGSTAEVIQENCKAVRDFAANYRKSRQKALIIEGPTGSGKTSSVYAVASELGLEVVEMNASDFRNEAGINSIAGSASRQMSLFAKGKIILIDELDGIGGNEDRGGITAIAKAIDEASFPIIMTANDISDRKFSAIKRKSRLIGYTTPTYKDVHSVLQKVCAAEKIKYEEEALKKLALRAGGDIRGALNDLQMLSQATGKLTANDVEELSTRNREEQITTALLRIFKSTDINVAIEALENVDEELQKCSQWVQENLPYEYRHAEELKEAYESLSRADVFTGRIRRWQHWRFLVYVNALISAGVAIAKKKKNTAVMQYKEPTKGLKIYIMNSRYAKRNSIAHKIAEKANCSSRQALQQYVPYIKAACRLSTKMRQSIAEELELDEEEREWLYR